MTQSLRMWGVTASLTLLSLAPNLGATATFSTNLLRPPTGVYAANGNISYYNGIVIRNFTIYNPSQSFTPPAPFVTQTNYFTYSSSFDLSMDGGNTWASKLTNGNLWINSTNWGTLPSGAELYVEEIGQMDITIPTNSMNILFRESPTLASSGQTTIQSVNGGYEISSFFDVFTEISLDGGMTWCQSVGSTKVELVPEPGSVIALCSGLLGLTGLAFRKRAV